VTRLVRQGTHRFRPVASPWEGSPAHSDRNEWADIRRRAADPASSPVAGQAVAELPAAELAIAAAPATPWDGPATLHFSGPRALTGAQAQAARELLVNGESWAAVAQRFGVAVNTLRRHVRDISPRRSSEHPTEPARLPRGTVRWDLPLGLTERGHRTVSVECGACGCVRPMRISHLRRRDRPVSGLCEGCCPEIWRRMGNRV